MARKLKITFTGGGNLGDELVLPLESPILVGRSHSASIRFRESDVSGKHLEISMTSNCVEAVNLSRYKAMVNGVPLQPGAKCAVQVGDVFSIGAKARFRVDSLGSVEDEEKGAPTYTGMTHIASLEDGETKAMTQDRTFATRMPSTADGGTFATPLAPSDTNATFATKIAADADVLMAVNQPYDDSATAMVATGASSGVAGFADTPTGMVDPSTQTGASEADGATQVMQTRAGSMDEIERFKRLMVQKKRIRRSLLGFATVLFLSVLGAIVWIQWPKSEVWLTVPRISGSDKPDLSVFTLKTEGRNVLVVDFPNADGGRMRKTETPESSGLFVSTLTGRDRDVPFRLEVSQYSSNEELELALEESAQRKMAEMKEKFGMVFMSPSEWQSGCFFFESEYPGSCPSPRLMRGTRFYRSEYEVVRENISWHGIFFLFRDGVTAYVFQREIPVSQWSRGKWLLREDPNLQLFPSFMSRRWESPGRKLLIVGKDVQTLVESVNRELESLVPRVAEWPRVKAELDTLLVMTWNGKADLKKQVFGMLEKYRKLQDKKYVEFRNEFELSKQLGKSGQKRMRTIRSDCKSVFGKDPSDRRFYLVGNPETWSCQEKH